MDKSVSVIWKKRGVSGRLEITNAGRLDRDSFDTGAGNRLDFAVSGAKLDPGAFGSIVTVRAGREPFSFFVRDVKANYPVYIREYGVVVTEGGDKRGYDEIVAAVDGKGYVREIDRFETGPETCFASAAAKTKRMRAPTWLGIGRDIRLFEVAPHGVVNDGALWDSITPLYHHTGVKYPEMGDAPIRFDYFAGRGIGCRYDVTRWLEDRVLPILNVLNEDGGIRYEQKLFVTNEIAPLAAGSVRGTHYLISDKYSACPTVRTPEQQAETDRIHDREIYRDDETVLYLRIEAVNTAKVPRYAFVRLPQPNVFSVPELSVHPVKFEDGCGFFSATGRVFMTAALNGRPFSEVDSSVLLPPGGKAVYVCKIPHCPVSKERAEALMKTDFDEKLAECAAYWRRKLDRVADISLPEKRIEEMMKAGFLHLDLVCYGNEPDDPVAPVVGVYPPIGTESTPIIQYIESLGDAKLAERAIMYFIKKQRPDGFMQNFEQYMSETGCVLWNIGEHFKYTCDAEWLRSVEDNIVRAFEYIRKWSDESRDERLRGRGYGMIYGKVADCDHPFRSYMLNAMTYGGLRSCADALAHIGSEAAGRIGAFAEELKGYIIDSLTESFAVAPVVPLSDGSWCPSVSLWPERNVLGLQSLFSLGGACYTHGSMVIEDDNLGGGHYLVTNGVLAPDSVFVKFISNVFADMLSIDNVAFSQPYYCVHPYTHLRLGQVGAFLSEFYCNMSALADRETYTFWEHLYQLSPHKTHEEAWFLMRCRWMLYIDDFGVLQLLGGVPRSWFESGKRISFGGMAARCGRLSVSVVSELDAGVIRAAVRLEPNGMPIPETLSVRLPHPFGKKASGVSAGEYCPEKETVYIKGFTGNADISLKF